MAREEYNLFLTAKAYEHLRKKTDGNLITKKRYCIPGKSGQWSWTFLRGCFQGLVIAEVEFSSVEEANSFVPLPWFGEDVTWSSKYHNSVMSQADPDVYRRES